MNNPNFDTHKFVEDIVQAKMPKAQAEVLAGYYARLLNDSITILNDSIATLKDSTANKDDLNNLEKRFGDKLEQTEKIFGYKLEQTEKRFGDKLEHSQQLLEEKIKQSEQRLWIRMLVGQITSVGLIIGALQYWS